jgi:hypothetical protein
LSVPEAARDWFKCIRYEHVVAALAVLALLFDTLVKPISAISLGLLIVAFAALSPWWRQVPRYPESAEIPGGLKMKFRQWEQEAEKAGLLATPQPDAAKQPVYLAISSDDPTLSLVALRVAIERRLRELASTSGITVERPSITNLTRALEEAGQLTWQQAAALRDLLPTLNRAVHAGDITPELGASVVKFGSELLAGLDQKVVAAGAPREALWGNTTLNAVGIVTSPPEVSFPPRLGEASGKSAER